MRLLDTMYATKIDISSRINAIGGIYDDRLQNKKILPIENYDMQFYGNNKIVALWQKNLEPMLYVTGEFINKKGELKTFQGGDPIFLYMPEGSNELKVW